jgi:hypothetical protein
MSIEAFAKLTISLAADRKKVDKTVEKIVRLV